MSKYVDLEAAIAETRKPRLTDAELRRRLASLPAADVVPVVHGLWMWTERGPEDWEKYYVCSNCGEHTFWQTNYCQNCGAKMEKDNG